MTQLAPRQLSFFDFAATEGLRPRAPVPERHEVLGKAQALGLVISRQLKVPVQLSVTDNRSTMVSFKRHASSLELRLHHRFLDAPAGVVQALADYAGRGHGPAGQLLDDYIRGRQPLIRHERTPHDSDLTPHGRFFRLDALFQKVNAEHFRGTIRACIGWGRMPSRRRRKSIRLGVYNHQAREIRIHPALDHPEVPAFFVEFIVFHEMLHQLFPSSGQDEPGGRGRRNHHPRAFRERERAFPLYEPALRWERENLRLLLER